MKCRAETDYPRVSRFPFRRTRVTWALGTRLWRQRKLFVFSWPVSSPISLRSEALPTVLTTVTATVCRERLVVQIVSAEKHVPTVPTITNVALASSAVMAATVRQCALSGPVELLLVL